MSGRSGQVNRGVFLERAVRRASRRGGQQSGSTRTSAIRGTELRPLRPRYTRGWGPSTVRAQLLRPVRKLQMRPLVSILIPAITRRSGLPRHSNRRLRRRGPTQKSLSLTTDPLTTRSLSRDDTRHLLSLSSRRRIRAQPPRGTGRFRLAREITSSGSTRTTFSPPTSLRGNWQSR